jgi:hypothetical protein
MDQPCRNDRRGVQARRAMAAIMVAAYRAVDGNTRHMPGFAPGDYGPYGSIRPNGSIRGNAVFVTGDLVMRCR